MNQDEEGVPLPGRLRGWTHTFFLNEYSLYLSDVGRLSAAACCYRRNIALQLDLGSWKNASITSAREASSSVISRGGPIVVVV